MFVRASFFLCAIRSYLKESWLLMTDATSEGGKEGLKKYFDIRVERYKTLGKL